MFVSLLAWSAAAHNTRSGEDLDLLECEISLLVVRAGHHVVRLIFEMEVWAGLKNWIVQIGIEHAAGPIEGLLVSHSGYAPHTRI